MDPSTIIMIALVLASLIGTRILEKVLTRRSFPLETGFSPVGETGFSSENLELRKSQGFGASDRAQIALIPISEGKRVVGGFAPLRDPGHTKS
jgi:hypothetical protein